MAKLLLMFNEQVIREFPFIKESISIGRKPENDIHIDNLGVSGSHAKIDKTGSAYTLTDLQSTNGTFVNEKKIVSHRLKHGDSITIGKHVILFLASEKERVEQMAVDKTMILDTAKQRELLTKQGIVPPTQKPEKTGMLTFLDGSDLGEIELTKKLTRIGKSRDAEVRLPGLFMRATAATISKRPSGYTITFAGGMKRLRVNGRVIKDSARLKNFDTIEIGSHKLQFYHKESEKP